MSSEEHKLGQKRGKEKRAWPSSMLICHMAGQKGFSETAPERQLKSQFTKHIRNKKLVRYFTLAVHD